MDTVRTRRRRHWRPPWWSWPARPGRGTHPGRRSRAGCWCSRCSRAPGCRLGNRTLKLKDTGKMAAVFMDVQRNRSLRLAVRESANHKAIELFPGLERLEALSRAYHTFAEHELFCEQWVRVHLASEDL
ncbi:MAG: FmdE family protein, partial [Streptosporangiaceae bacterium]